MPTYLYWGEDEFQIAQAVQELHHALLDPMWLDFNFVKIVAMADEQIIDGLNYSATPPFGSGDRLTWLASTTITQKCSDTVRSELDRTLANLPPNSHLLLTTSSKPDGRLKSTKLLQKSAIVKEFSPIPPWKTDAIVTFIKKTAQNHQLELTEAGVELLADTVGNNSRRLHMELEKLKLWQGDRQGQVDTDAIASLVNATAHNSLQLAKAILAGDLDRSLSLLAELMGNNEASLKICATLTGQFRTWLWVRLLVESGERDDRKIAEVAGVGNPKRIYFLKQEIRPVSASQLLQAMPILLQLEADLKRGREEAAMLQTAIVQLYDRLSSQAR
ncbi:DNA polymerase III, delta subunit [Thalassoporum mexicanum PCC 7367]|uniref:DNA polymerase III subunit delta n=1 Tax=Thalassoporum mexicanum TaxID=3457544 RepID=UPI00029FFD0E|nr:DNA polymerase III subunit delta [Pseudanabaena sp. PCC 7367]AFY70593.1 DNA polymerase III, delta subunit [Pseudanabaena sp. PCC 7367]